MMIRLSYSDALNIAYVQKWVEYHAMLYKSNLNSPISMKMGEHLSYNDYQNEFKRRMGFSNRIYNYNTRLELEEQIRASYDKTRRFMSEAIQAISIIRICYPDRLSTQSGDGEKIFSSNAMEMLSELLFKLVVNCRQGILILAHWVKNNGDPKVFINALRIINEEDIYKSDDYLFTENIQKDMNLETLFEQEIEYGTLAQILDEYDDFIERYVMN